MSSVWRLACLAALGLVVLYFLTLGKEPLAHFLDDLRNAGWIPFYCVFTFCISAGVPASPFLLVAGGTFDLSTNVIGLTLSFVVSLAISYFYATRLFRRQLGEFLSAKTPILAQVAQAHPILVILLARMTPGFPYALQNCFLVTVCKSFATFFVASLPPLILMATLFTMVGRNLISGNYLLLLVFVFILAAIALVFRYISNRHQAKTM